jgi:L-alanine-DL-glutamate epimerase-like enolase superfamily enzyme
MAIVQAPPAVVPIERVDVSAYTIPTDAPESDGTLAWTSTTLVVVDAVAGGRHGVGYTYADIATAVLVRDLLAHVVRGRDVMAVTAAWAAMRHAIRNLGRPGIASMAMAAVDAALWDLKARVFDVPLVTLLGQVHVSVPEYGSGGFTSYPLDRLERQLGEWARHGIAAVKMKIGRERDHDCERVRAARDAIAGMDVAAGEYGYDLPYFERMLEAGAVDCLQADASRCAGITEFLRVAALCDARSLPLSSHTAPSLHLHPCAALAATRHMEYFHDHVRIERMLFDGAMTPVGGRLAPDLTRPGLGLEFKRADAARYEVH